MPVRIADRSKRSQGEGGKFHMLFCKRKSYDGYGHQDPKNKVYNGDIKTAKQDPQNVKKQVQAASSGSFKIKRLSKGSQWKYAKFNELNPERNPDDGKADYQSSQEVKKSNKDTTAKYHP